MNTDIGDVADIFDAALALPLDERSAHLQQACHGDERLAQRVKELLDAHDRADQVLLKPPSAAGSSLGHALDAEHPGDVAGTRIGRYTLVRMIALGGMGVVYEAEQDNPRRSVALKVMKGGIATKSVLRRFEFETQVLGRLQHPNIAHIHDAGVHETELGPVPYFAMELIDNAKTIIEYADEESLNSAARLQLFARVCRAVHHGHQKGVIHRDLKPSNVLVDASGEPKIIDFGVARATDSDASLTGGHTDSGKVIGTVQYMSPEQAGGRTDELDTRSDVYSLGVLLFELLSGSLPYELEERAILDAVRIIQQDEPAALGSVSTTLRGDIETIVAKAIEKEPARRYQSADDLAADIRRYLNNEPIEAHPATVSYQLAKFARRNKPLVGGAAATVAALIIGVIGTTTFAYRAAVQRSLAEQREQETLREQIRTLDQQQIAEAVNDFLTEDLLAAVAPSSESGRGRDVLMRAVLDAASEKIEEASQTGGRFADKPLIEASIRATLGWTYFLLGEYGAAEPHLERARLLRRRELGEEHPSTLSSMNNLAALYDSQGRYDEAEKLYVKTLEIRTRVLGEEHPRTLDSMSNLAVLYYNRSRYAEAEPLYVKTLAIRKRVEGDEHPHTLQSITNLANLYYAQGRYDEAEPLQVKTLEINKRVLGEAHPDTLGSMGNLANLYYQQARYDEAEPLFVETLEIMKGILGEEHPDTLTSMSNLANLYWSQGRYDETEPMYVKTLAIRKRVQGDEHPHTLDSMHNLASLYQRQGRYDEAESMYVKTLEIKRRVLGEEHSAALMSMNSLAILYMNQGRYDEAEPLYVKTLASRKRVLGEEHRSTLGSITNLGNLYLSMKRFDDARAMFERSLPVKRRVLTMRHPWTRNALRGLARAYDGLDRAGDALPLWRELQEFQLAQVENPDASAQALNAAAWDLLSSEHAELRDPARALPLAQRAVDKAAGVDPGILDTLALAQHLTGDTPAAIETEKKALSLLPPDAPGRSDYEAALARFEAAQRTAKIAGEPGGG